MEMKKRRAKLADSCLPSEQEKEKISQLFEFVDQSELQLN